MTDEDTGLPADNIDGVARPRDALRLHLADQHRRLPVAHRRRPRTLGIIGKREARQRLTQTLATVATLERHEPSGMFYNWYDQATGAKLTHLARNGDPVYPFLSSVDNGWLAAALMVVAHRRAVAAPAGRRAPASRWTSAFYDADQFGGDAARACSAAASGPTRRRGPVAAATTATSRRPPVYYTVPPLRHHSTPSRGSPATSASPRGQIPPAHYFATVPHVPGHLRLVLAGAARRSA